MGGGEPQSGEGGEGREGRGGNDSVGVAWDKNQGQKPRLDPMLPETRGRRDKRHGWGAGTRVGQLQSQPCSFALQNLPKSLRWTGELLLFLPWLQLIPRCMKDPPVLEPGKACPVSFPPRDQGHGVRLGAFFWSHSQPSYNLPTNSKVLGQAHLLQKEFRPQS